MTTIVDVLKRAARQCSVDEPSSWISTVQDDQVELRDDHLRETVEDIAMTVDCAAPVGAKYDLAGDGSESYDLPAAFLKLHRDELAVYDATLDRPCIPSTKRGAYTMLKDLGHAGIVRHYRLEGYEGNWSIFFEEPPATGTTINIHYNTNLWAATAAGAAKATFTDATDVILFPRRLVETGIVWRWRERKGLDHLDKYNEYQTLMAQFSNQTRMRTKISFGGQRAVRWQDMVPSTIPSS